MTAEISPHPQAQAYQPRSEWEGLTLCHPDCPIVRSIDAAQNALNIAKEKGIVDGKPYRDRVASLSLRRVVVAASQQTFGCSRLQAVETEATLGEDLGHGNSQCSLPTSEVNDLAFGSSPERLFADVQHYPGMGFTAR